VFFNIVVIIKDVILSKKDTDIVTKLIIFLQNFILENYHWIEFIYI